MPRSKTQAKTTWKAEDRGFALISSLLLIALLTVMGVSALMTTDLEVQTTANQRSATQAFYIAEAGLTRAAAKLNGDADWMANLADATDAFANDNSIGNGSYRVEVLADTPESGRTTIRSFGQVDGFNQARTAISAVGRSGGYPGAYDYGFIVCNNAHLQGGSESQVTGDVFVEGSLTLSDTDVAAITGDVYTVGRLDMNSGSVVGDVFSNGRVNLDSSTVPNVDGNLTTGDLVRGGGTVSGTTSDYANPDPVINICEGGRLYQLVYSAENIQDYRDNATTTLTSLDLNNETSPYSGVVHVDGNMSVTGDLVLDGDVVFVVDGNVHVHGPGTIRSDPPGHTATFIVPENNVHVQANGDLEMDGAFQIGTVEADGTPHPQEDNFCAHVGYDVLGGTLHVQGGANMKVNGSVILASGHFHSQGGSTFTVAHQPPSDPNTDVSDSGGFRLTHWREIRN